MNTIRNILSNTRLPSFTFPAFSMTPPCEIITEFFYVCGHTVTSRRCRNNARLWRDNGYHHPSVACDAQCPTRSLHPVTHMYLSCSWCRQFPRIPYTNSIRSDPGVDRLDPGELRRRQDYYLAEWRPRLTEGVRAAFFRNVGRRALWETHMRLEHDWEDRQGVTWQERTYFMGEGYDDRLLIPIDPSTMQGEDCGICRQSLAGNLPVHLPCADLHRYHAECIEMWLLGNRVQSCPHCRHWFKIVTYNEWNTQTEDFIRFFVDYRPPLEIEEEFIEGEGN